MPIIKELSILDANIYPTSKTDYLEMEVMDFDGNIQILLIDCGIWGKCVKQSNLEVM